MAHGRPAKRRRLTPAVDDNAASETVKARDLFHRAADWDLETDYAQRSRREKHKESTRLPTKNSEGRVQEAQEAVHFEDESDSLESGSEEDNGYETPPTDELEETPAVSLKGQLLSVKEELARLAGLINEDPEEHAGTFKKIAQYGEAPFHPDIRKLAFATQVTVYKDVIPGYRIRPYNNEELGSKVSRDVRKTRQYEQSLVSGYQSFVKQLMSIGKAKTVNEDEASLKLVAIHCACALLLAVPHFNFRSELLGVIVREVSVRKISPEYTKCIETVESFFDDDEDGAPSFEAVTLLTKMMKTKDYRIREELLHTFFHLRLLSELSRDRSDSRSRKGPDLSRLHGRRVKKDKWEHRSKKEKKLARERKAVEKDMKEADAAVNYEERDRLQSETLKLVFATYFRILKARVPHLMGAVLEGLAKYAHLINQDLFGDLLEALRELVSQAENLDETDREADNELEPDQERNRTRESLLSTQTAFTLLSGQEISKSASALNLDLSFFTSHAYRNLYPLSLDADIELGPKSLHLADPHKSTSAPPPKVNISTPVLLLIRVLTSILLTPSQPPPTQVAASFYKRLLTISLHLPEKSTLAILSLMNRLVEKHSRKLEPLWYSDERKGDGVFHGESDTVEGTNVFSVGSGAWEAELLRHHYCPKVRDEVKAIDKIIAGLHR